MGFETVKVMDQLSKNMISFRAITASLLFFAGQLAVAGSIDPSCKSQEVSDPLVAGRAYKIEFPDGRVVTTVGHLHGTRQIYEISDLELSGKLAKMTDQEFQAYIEKILKDNTTPTDSLQINSNRKKAEQRLSSLGVDGSRFFNSSDGYDLKDVTVLNQAKQDYLFLKGQLDRKSGAPQFVGYEGTEATWKNNVPYYLHAQSALLSEFAFRKARGAITLTEADIKSAILSGSNGSIYAYMQDRSLAQRVPMIGVEDAEAGEKYQKADPLETINKAMKSLTAADDAYWDARPKSELEAFKKNPENLRFVALLTAIHTQVINMEITSLPDLDQKIQVLSEHKFPWMSSQLDSLFAAYRQRVRLNIGRDSNSARNLAGIYMSGIHFVGLNHLKDTVENLERICTAEKNGTNRGYGNTGTPSGSVR